MRSIAQILARRSSAAEGHGVVDDVLEAVGGAALVLFAGVSASRRRVMGSEALLAWRLA